MISDDLGLAQIRVMHRVGPMELPRSPCGPAVHTFVVLALQVGGRTRVEHHGEFELRAGHMHLVPAGDAHRVVSASGPEVWTVAFCRSCLDPDRYGQLLAPLDRVRQGASPVVELPAARQEYVLDLFRELDREQKAAGAMPVVAESLLALVLAEVVRARGAAAAPPRPLQPPSLVADALAVIEARCLGPLTLKEVAHVVRRTPAHVTTAVKQATGRTVVAWIVEGRMAEARRRLLSTDEYVDAIAERVGYADPSHFVRLFRRHHGATPAAWRARHRAAG
ncbi:AraC family transcriptional regulator [Sorangium cellulosum]|uniref:AraC family transcriptional regulator n=1 Tax=Sorangium cellulosum TaxID=56 RepID=A0A2L0F4K3_SORCE|nr:AraC family transcriptional regulator [Sorangium cellulosum]AUX46482.1 AraC family transcriptional regulator [Sorangium cellulosum]